jgi:hypothetical protein
MARLLKVGIACCAAAASAFATIAIAPVVEAENNSPGVVDVSQNPTAVDKAQYGQDKSRRANGAGVDRQRSRRADETVRSDRFFAKLAGGRAYTTLREGPWTRLNGEIIGVLREVTFAKPLDVTMRHWPSIRYDEANDTYSRHLYQVEVRGMTSVVLFIDDKRGLVGAQPDSGATELVGPDNEISETESTH